MKRKANQIKSFQWDNLLEFYYLYILKYNSTNQRNAIPDIAEIGNKMTETATDSW
jgi:hypothetical protein